MTRSPPPVRPDPTPKISAARVLNANAAMDAHAKGELVRTSFDRVYPGMPPALRITG